MIVTSQFDVEELFENRFDVDFIQATLKQRVDSSPILYSGPANVTMDANGDLKLKLFHISPDANSLKTALAGNFDASKLTLGKLISDEHYYDFEGFDSIKNKWTATQLWLTQNVSTQTGGIIITAKLSSIGIIRNPRLASPSALAYFSSAFDIPLFHAKFVGVMNGFASVELDIDNRKVVIIKYPAFYELKAELHNSQEPEKFFDITLEALGIAFGLNLAPRIKCVSTSDGSKIEIFSSSTTQPSLIIPSPLRVSECYYYDHISNFVKCYVNTIAKGNDVLAGYWARLINAFQCNVEIRALALTTAIEGILVEYYKASVKHDPAFLTQLDEASQVIKNDVKGNRAKKLLTQSISVAKATKVKDILFAIVKNGCITQEQAELWVILRNKSAHAAKLKLEDPDIQNYMNQLYGCLELFYRLILGRVGFSGEIRMYSLDGWPYGAVEFNYETLVNGTPPPPDELNERL